MMQPTAMRLVLLLAGMSIMTLTDVGAAQSPLPLRPYCLGRFEIGLPERSKVDEDDKLGWLGYDAAFGWTKISSTTPRAVARRALIEKDIIERIGRIKPPPGETTALKSTQRIDSQTTEFVYRPTPRSHAHVALGEFVPGRLAVEGLFERGGRLFLLHDTGKEEARAKVSADLYSLAARVRARDDAEIPTEPGFCIPGGFITGRSAPGHERISVDFRVPSHPELVIETSITVRKNVSGSTPKERAERARRMLSELGAKTKQIHFRDRTLAGVPGFEDAAILGLPGQQKILFTWQSNPEAESLARPAIRLSLETLPDTVLKSMPEAQVVALWNALTQSFRMRPNALGSNPTPTPTPTRR